jgi:hypothetical protein
VPSSLDARGGSDGNDAGCHVDSLCPTGEDLRAAAQNPIGDFSVPFQNNTFTTVGYGDIVLGREWRQLGTFEAINGWVIFGWATALIIAVIQRLYFRSGKT